MRKRILSILLVVVMCFTMMPPTTFAADTLTEGDTIEVAEEVTDLTVETTEPAPVCDCGTNDVAIHATTCAVYAAPENPECYCVEKCTEVNVWCDVCGFDVTACEGGEATAAVYQVGDTFDGFLHSTDNRTDYSVTYRFTILSDGTTPDVELTGIVYGTPTELILAGNTYTDLATNGKGDLYKIVSIGEKAFYNCTTLTKVNLGNCKVTEVKDSAFENCTALTSLDLTDVQTIGNRAFYACGVTSLDDTALGGVVSIGEEAFADCAALEELYLPASVTEMGVEAFSGCSALSSLTLQSGIKTLGTGGAFVGCSSLSRVTIPGSITVIPVYTFSICENLEILSLSEGVTEIGFGAFLNCNLTRCASKNQKSIETSTKMC